MEFVVGILLLPLMTFIMALSLLRTKKKVAIGLLIFTCLYFLIGGGICGVLMT